MRICFIGDSLVNGYGDGEFLGWTGRLCRAARETGHDMTCYNLGVRGQTSADIMARWEREALIRLSPDTDGRAVFSFGVNDMKYEEGACRVPLPESLSNLRNILVSAECLYPVLMIGPPPVDNNEQNLRIEELTREYGVLCDELGIPYLDLFHRLINSVEWMDDIRVSDGTHPGARGYGLFSRHVAAWAEWRSWF